MNKKPIEKDADESRKRKTNNRTYDSAAGCRCAGGPKVGGLCPFLFRSRFIGLCFSIWFLCFSPVKKKHIAAAFGSGRRKQEIQVTTDLFFFQ